MSFGFDAPEDVEGAGGGFLDQPGTFHFVVTQLAEGMGKGKTPKPINGFTVHADCLAGTADGCEGKSHSESLFSPDPSKSEGSQLANRRAMAAFFIAVGLMTPDQLGKPVNIDLEAAVGKQFVMRLRRQMEMDGDGEYTIESKYLQLDYASIYHVDDPEVKDIPKSDDALGMIDKSERHGADWFAFKAKGKPASAKAESASAAAAAESFDDVDAL